MTLTTLLVLWCGGSVATAATVCSVLVGARRARSAQPAPVPALPRQATSCEDLPSRQVVPAGR